MTAFGAARANNAYKHYGNPLDAWNCIQNCLVGGHPIPDESRKYLLRVALVLGNPRLTPNEKKVAGHVMKSLELTNGRGGPSKFSQRATLEKVNSVLVRARVLNSPARNEKGVLHFDRWNDALDRAAQDAGMDEDTIKRYVRRIRTKQSKSRP